MLPLPREPNYCCALGMPGLKQLPSQRLQALCINGGFDRAIHPLNIEPLSNTQTDHFLDLAISEIDKAIMKN